MNVLRVMTFNIRHGERSDGAIDLEAVVRTIREAKADVVGLQEVDCYVPRSGCRDQAAEIAGALGWHHAFQAAITGEGLCGSHSSRYGVAVVSRYPILSQYGERLASTRGREARAFLHVEIGWGESSFHLICTHLGLDQSERLAHLERILAYGQRLPSPKAIVGDWNARPESEEVQAMSVAGWLDAASEVPGGPKPTFSYRSSPPGQPNVRIDYIFIDRGLQANEADVLSAPVSDHLPVLVTIRRREADHRM